MAVQLLPLLAGHEDHRRKEIAQPRLSRELGGRFALRQLRPQRSERRPHRVGSRRARLPVALELLVTQLAPHIVQNGHGRFEPVSFEPRVRHRLVTELVPALLRLDARALDVLVEDVRDPVLQQDRVWRGRSRLVDRPPAPAEQPAHVGRP
jgi:hypothetical protein